MIVYVSIYVSLLSEGQTNHKKFPSRLSSATPPITMHTIFQQLAPPTLPILI